MWINVKMLAAAIGKSPRLIQIKAKNGEITSRHKDGKSLEIEVESCPAEWQEMVASIGSVNYVPQIPDTGFSKNALQAIGRNLSSRESLRIEVASFVKGLDKELSEKSKVKIAVAHFGLSDSTVRRYIKDVDENGIVSSRKGVRQRSWDDQAISYMKAYYLQLLKERNIDSKQASFLAVSSKAQEAGWKIGSRSAAYRILSEIPRIYIEYATGGNRALDNIFYIKRDWSKLNPAQILIGDQHIADFWVVDNSGDKPMYFRPTFYVWLDAATRCVAGLAVDKDYDSGTVLNALYMAIKRFGFFDCTYNDNGTSECSKAATSVIDELLILSKGRSRMFDISDLYKTKNGSYAVEDEEGNIVDTAEDIEAWRRKHRRIYAQVKNAKAKPIERFFSTLEEKLGQKGIPGHVVTPNCPASQEEKESLVLQMQKEKGEILALDEFVWEVARTITEYENTPHSQLGGMTPMQKLRECEKTGWRAVYPESQIDLDFVFMSRKLCKVRKGRVVVNRIEFIGEDLKASSDGRLIDTGLILHEGEKVEVRFNPLSLDKAYAVIPEAKENRIRALMAVESVEMLDDGKLERSMAWKRSCMKVIRDSFKLLANPELAEKPRIGSQMEKEIQEADRALLATEETMAEEAVDMLLSDEIKEKGRIRPYRPLFSNSWERFKWCLDRIIANDELSGEDREFCERYRIGDEYSSNREYWEAYIRFGGIV